jgi:hypothetical protein
MPKSYRGEFTNSQVLYSTNEGLEQNVIVLIIDQTDPSGETVEIELADNPVTIRVVDNNEDKFTPIRSKSCEIRLHTNPNINIMTFGAGGDNQYKVQICMNYTGNTIFEGWLSISDLRQDFQPDPNVLVLTATDGLGFLKDLPLTDYNGNRFSGPHRLADYIAGCLAKTGLDKTLIAEMNVKESTQVTTYLGHMYNTIYLDARTFMSSIDEFNDCFTVLEKILGEYCELSQQKDEWYIRAIDEFDAQSSIQVRFNANGTISGALPEVEYNKLIGSNMNLYQMGFMNDDTQVSLQRPYKFVRHQYQFEQPQELPCNSNFERGDFITDLPNEVINFETYTQKKYKLECWDLLKGSPPTFNQFSSGDLWIKRLFEGFNREAFRYVVVNWPTNPPEALVVKSKGIDVAFGDKFRLSWDFAFDSNLGIGSGNLIVASILLEGNDGTYWFLNDPTGTATTSLSFPANRELQMNWALSNANWSTNYKLLTINEDFSIYDNTEFRSITIDNVAPMPVDGKLFIIYHWGNNVSFASHDLRLNNLRFEYLGQINGAWEAFTGFENKTEQAGDYKASRDVDVFVTDSPKLLYKGTFQKVVGNALVIDGTSATITFFNGNYFTLPGYWAWKFVPGMTLLISGTTNNNSSNAVVTDVAYSIIGNVTTVTLSITTVAEVDSSYTISTYRYGLTEGFYNGAVFPDGPPDSTYIKPYSQIQNEAVWNQYNRVFSIFEGTIDGLDTYVLDSIDRYDLPDLMHSYFLMDNHPATNNKKFKLLHFDQDPDLCEWNGVFIEVFDSTIPKVYTGHSFKFLSND